MKGLTDEEINEVSDFIKRLYKYNYILKYNGKGIGKFMGKPDKETIAEHLFWLEDDSLNNMTVRELKEYIESGKYILEKIANSDNK